MFDHTALINTILLRFADGNYEGMPARVRSSSHLGHVLTDGPTRTTPIPEPDLTPVKDWWAEQIRFSLRHPSATIPALQELGVVEGPPGEQHAMQGLARGLGRALDWIRKRLGREPESARRRPPEPRRPGPRLAPTEASELQVGVAAAARHIREEGLPPGQP
ncbi:MAG TPA: hypothetical protein VGV57_09280 [Thermoleophilaceae bacterium]|nr:hypothetical protein [Thermoleophilaceae bacterium]